MSNCKYPNQHHKLVIKNDEHLWSAILQLIPEYQDEFPFDTIAVVRQVNAHTDRPISKTLINRQRGGLAQFYRDSRGRMLTEFQRLLDNLPERGTDSTDFYRALSQLIADHHSLIELDIKQESHHNTRQLLSLIRPLVAKNRYWYFFVDFYLLLTEWHGERFARDFLSLSRYSKRFRALFEYYQIFKSVDATERQHE